jgi:hypothetical protein
MLSLVANFSSSPHLAKQLPSSANGFSLVTDALNWIVFAISFLLVMKSTAHPSVAAFLS